MTDESVNAAKTRRLSGRIGAALAIVSVAASVLSLAGASPADAACQVSSSTWWPWYCGAPTWHVQKAAEIAVQQNGKPYAWGGNGPSSFDCSGLVYYSFYQAGFRVSDDTSGGMYYRYGRRVGLWEKRPGDVLFYSSNGTPSGIYHVAIYLGYNRDNGKYEMIEALNPSSGVRISQYRTSGLLNEVVRMDTHPLR